MLTKAILLIENLTC